MRISDLSLPHPVLGISDDIKGEFVVTPEITLERDSIGIELEYSLSNPSVEELIDNNKAEFVTEISCQETLFRDAYRTTNNKQEINIDSELLRDEVDLTHWIVASSDIPYYGPSNANEDYLGATFNIEKGDVLAYGKSHTFLAEKSWLEFMSVSSFMVIRKDDGRDTGSARYDLDNDQIKIWLAKDDFEKYHKNRIDNNLSPIFHSAIVLPALIYALSYMISNPEVHSDRKWYLHLMLRRENDATLKNMSWDLNNVPAISQALLKDPLNRTFTGIESFIESFQKNSQQE